MTALLQISGYVRRQSAKGGEKRPRFTPEQIATASQIQTEIDASFVLAVTVALAKEFPGDTHG